MLGKGLESLIPKKQNIQSPQQNQQTSQQQPLKEVDNFRKDDERNLAPKKSVSEAERAWFPSEERESEAESQGASASLGRETPSFRGARLSSKKLSAEDSIFYIETEKIKPNPHQPRRDFNEESLKELASSIREHGIIQPIVVSKIENETDFGTTVEYQLIAGERRLRAAKLAGLERVPTIIKNIIKDAEHLELAIIENLQRADLNSIETARAYAKLQDVFGLTQREVAQRLGKSRETIANTLRLLNLPTEIQEAVARNKINESQARLLLIISDPLQQQNLFNEIISSNLSVRELRNRIKKPAQSSILNPQSLIQIDPEIHHLQEQLAELLSAKVKIEPFGNTQGKGGKIIIDFYSPEEIEGIIKKLLPGNSLEQQSSL